MAGNHYRSCSLISSTTTMKKTLWVLALILGSIYSANAWSYVGCFTREKLDVQEKGTGSDSSSCVDYCYEKYGNPIAVMVGG